MIIKFNDIIEAQQPSGFNQNPRIKAPFELHEDVKEIIAKLTTGVRFSSRFRIQVSDDKITISTATWKGNHESEPKPFVSFQHAKAEIEHIFDACSKIISEEESNMFNGG